MVKEVDFITGDIRDQNKLAKAMNGVDVVIHCAALVDIGLVPNEKELYSVNVEGMSLEKKANKTSVINW